MLVVKVEVQFERKKLERGLFAAERDETSVNFGYPMLTLESFWQSPIIFPKAIFHLRLCYISWKVLGKILRWL